MTTILENKNSNLPCNESGCTNWSLEKSSYCQLHKKENNVKNPRSGKSWSVDEENKLKKLISEGKTIKDVVPSMERTANALYCRIKQIAYKEIKSGGDKKTVLDKYKIGESDYDVYTEKTERLTVKTEKKKAAPKKHSVTEIYKNAESSELQSIKIQLDSMTNLLNLIIKQQQEHSQLLHQLANL